MFIFGLVKLIINGNSLKTNIKRMIIKYVEKENRVYKFRIYRREKWNKEKAKIMNNSN